MKALVLTYDDHLPVARLVIETYLALWPDNPFHFRLPYNQPTPPSWGALERCLEWIPSPRPIRGTMEALLADIQDEEWVYFCMDDKVPLSIDIRSARRIHRFVSGLKSPDIATVMLTRNNGVNDHLDFFSWKFGRHGLFLEKTDYHNFYQHQFVRARLLKRAFLSREIPEDPRPSSHWEVNELLGLGDFPQKPTLPNERAFVPFRNAMLLSESFMQGRLTAACAETMEKYGIPIPAELPRTDASWILSPEDSLSRSATGLYHRLKRQIRSHRRPLPTTA